MEPRPYDTASAAGFPPRAARGVLLLSGVGFVFAAACSRSGPSCSGKATLLKRCFGDTQFVAYRDGAGPWQTPKTDSNGMSELCVTDDYEAVAASGSGSNFSAIEIASTVRESTSDTQCRPPGASPVTVRVNEFETALARNY